MNRIDTIGDPLRIQQSESEPEPTGSGVLTRLRAINPLFVASVIVPTLIATIYFGVLASDVYVSESRFIVRSPGKPSISPLGAFLGGSAMVGASEENDAVMEFLSSRQALSETNADGLLTRAWANPEVLFFDRFGWSGSRTDEHLYEYYLGKVEAEKSTKTSVTLLRVKAFDPLSAQQINSKLLERSEILVNELSNRARGDAIQFSQAQVDAAKTAAKQAAFEVARYRDQNRVIDPELQATAGLQFVSKLQDELIATRSQLLQLQTYTPQATQIPFLRTRIHTLEQEIAEQTSSLAGGKGSLSSASARYQELVLASEFAEKQLAMALASFQEAQAEAARKQAYVERISNPSLPDYAEFPRRIRNILATFVLGLLAWGIVSMLLVGVREHRD
jgi:capsular polysaccharide transport system permease protein